MILTTVIVELCFQLIICAFKVSEQRIMDHYEAITDQDDAEKKTEQMMKRFRGAFGWFRDVADNLGGRCFKFNIPRIVQYGSTTKHLLVFPNPFYSKEMYGRLVDIYDVGGEDSGFVTLMYGFGVFFLCICIAPATCFGVWLQWPVWFRLLPLDQAWWLVFQ
jgi:hypothetical protein